MGNCLGKGERHGCERPFEVQSYTGPTEILVAHSSEPPFTAQSYIQAQSNTGSIENLYQSYTSHTENWAAHSSEQPFQPNHTLVPSNIRRHTSSLSRPNHTYKPNHTLAPSEIGWHTAASNHSWPIPSAVLEGTTPQDQANTRAPTFKPPTFTPNRVRGKTTQVSWNTRVRTQMLQGNAQYGPGMNCPKFQGNIDGRDRANIVPGIQGLGAVDINFRAKGIGSQGNVRIPVFNFQHIINNNYQKTRRSHLGNQRPYT